MAASSGVAGCVGTSGSGAVRQNSHVSLVDPHLLPHLAADVCQALLAVEALGLEAAVAEHLDDLGILLALLIEDQLALVAVLHDGR